MVSPNPELSGMMSLFSVSKSASTIFSILETKYEASLITYGLNVPKSLHMLLTSSGFIPMPVSDTVNLTQCMLKINKYILHLHLLSTFYIALWVFTSKRFSVLELSFHAHTFDFQLDIPRVGEFQGVGEEAYEDLAEALAVAQNFFAPEGLVYFELL